MTTFVHSPQHIYEIRTSRLEKPPPTSPPAMNGELCRPKLLLDSSGESDTAHSLKVCLSSFTSSLWLARRPQHVHSIQHTPSNRESGTYASLRPRGDGVDDDFKQVLQLHSCRIFSTLIQAGRWWSKHGRDQVMTHQAGKSVIDDLSATHENTLEDSSLHALVKALA